MTERKLSKLEFQIMETLWSHGESSIREIQEAFPGRRKPRSEEHTSELQSP